MGSINDDIALIYTNYSAAELLVYQLENDIDDRTISAYAAAQHEGIGYIVVSLRAVIKDLIKAVQYLNYGYTNTANYGYIAHLCYQLNIKPCSLTYIDICNAWAADSFKGRAETIAYIDRMRQLIWNEPFNVIWASRPEGG